MIFKTEDVSFEWLDLRFGLLHQHTGALTSSIWVGLNQQARDSSISKTLLHLAVLPSQGTAGDLVWKNEKWRACSLFLMVHVCYSWLDLWGESRAIRAAVHDREIRFIIGKYGETTLYITVRLHHHTIWPLIISCGHSKWQCTLQGRPKNIFSFRQGKSQCSLSVFKSQSDVNSKTQTKVIYTFSGGKDAL